MMENVQKEMIMRLVNQPLITENYTATFSQTGPHGGTVVFLAHNSQQIAHAQWAVLSQDTVNVVVLSYNGKLELLRSPENALLRKLNGLPVF